VKSIHPNSVLAFWQGRDDLFGKRHQKVIAVLRTHTYAMTDRMVMNACGFFDPNAVRPRITELVEAGVVVEAGNTECPITHKTVRLVKLAKPKPAQAEFQLGDVVTPAVVETLNQRTA
jgi:hypothetical protein